MIPENFAVIGAAGYIAPRHLKAIKETGNRIIAVLDPHDSVGLLDQYSYSIDYFSETERFERYLQRLRSIHSQDQVNWVSVCSPNYLHDSHCRLAMEVGADVICEKPLVINPWNLDMLEEMEQRYERRVFTVLQLRLHPELLKLRDRLFCTNGQDTVHDVTLRYITPRGHWYHESWKGDEEKSGGLVTNIGVHLFDMLIWLFGTPQQLSIAYIGDKTLKGHLEMEHARVNWLLSIDKNQWTNEEEVARKPIRTFVVDGVTTNFSDGFTDLHTKVYEETLKGNGFGIADARLAIELTHRIREIIHAEEK